MVARALPAAQDWNLKFDGPLMSTQDGGQAWMSLDADDALTIIEALDNISDAFVIYDADGHLVVCNENFKALYRYTDDEARPGVHFRELGEIDVERGNVITGDETGREDYLDRKAAYRQTLKGSFVVQLADGRWIKTTDRRTKRGGIVSIQTDITDIKRAEQALRKAKELAETANRAKSEFLANMSHELRTPLNAIIGFGSVLEQELYGPHTVRKYREYAHDISEAGKHLLGLIDHILDIAKIENDAILLEEKVIDPVALNEWCANLFDDLTLRSGIVLTTTSEVDQLLLWGDPQRIRQVVVNLVSNAIKFTSPDGTIAVAWSQADGELHLRVTDTGAGIDPDFLPHVFEPFRQADTRGGPVEGAGLGLALVKRFVELHGGTITLDSELGAGTTVLVRFPTVRSVKQPQRVNA